jgi:hypothetical protein
MNMNQYKVDIVYPSGQVLPGVSFEARNDAQAKVLAYQEAELRMKETGKAVRPASLREVTSKKVTRYIDRFFPYFLARP